MTKAKLTLIVTPIAFALGLWGGRILLAPPISEAAITSSIPVEQIAQSAPKNLPDFSDNYQRHMGVLDTLKTP